MSLHRAVAALLAVSHVGCAADVGGPRSAGTYDHARELEALGGKGDETAPRKAWTLLLYGAADNELAPFILEDVEELESIGSSDEVSLVALVDTPDGAFRAYLLPDGHDGEIRSPRQELGDVDTGDPSTLAEFLRWGLSAYPADRTAVVISGHGGGVPRVVAPDDGTGNALSPSQLLSVLGEHTGSGRRIELVGADACLMQTIETAYELRYVTRFLVGSENTEPGSGWAYDRFTADLVANPDQHGGELGTTMIRTYAEDVGPTTPDFTLSLVSTDELSRPSLSGSGLLDEPPDNVFVQLDALAVALRDGMATSLDLTEQVHAAVRGTFRYRGAGLAGDDHDPYGDLDRFLFGLEEARDPDIRARVLDLRNTLYRLLPSVYVGSEADAAGARGLSVYLPLPGTIDAADLATYEASCTFCQQSAWSSFVAGYGLLGP